MTNCEQTEILYRYMARLVVARSHLYVCVTSGASTGHLPAHLMDEMYSVTHVITWLHGNICSFPTAILCTLPNTNLLHS